jgi:hypothetical protein
MPAMYMQVEIIFKQIYPYCLHGHIEQLCPSISDILHEKSQCNVVVYVYIYCIIFLSKLYLNTHCKLLFLTEICSM